MLKWALTVVLGCLWSSTLIAQLKKFYSLDEVSSFDTVNFNFKATSGHSYWRLVPQDNPLNIYGNPDLDKINPSFDAVINNRACNVNLELKEFRASGLGEGLAFSIFGSPPSEHDANYWKVLLGNDKVYNLDMHFGIGTSDIDLSGAKVQSLKVKTGRAKVRVRYDQESPNLSLMDTFIVHVDMGSFVAEDLDHSRAKYVTANIGFGKASLDFSHKLTNSCEVEANVGLGKLLVFLPKNEPVIIYIKDSPFRGLNMAKGFEEAEKNVYINQSYDAKADNLLTFKVDVSLGHATFRYKE